MPERIEITGPEPSGRRSGKKGRPAGLGLAVFTLNDTALKLGVVSLVLSIAYVAYGLITAPDSGYAGLPASEKARLLSNFALGLRLLVWGGVLVALAIAHRVYTDETVGYTYAVVGVIAVWGTPAIAGMLLPPGLPGLHELFNQAGYRLGWVLLAPGVLIILHDLAWKASDAWKGKRRAGTVAVPGQESEETSIGLFPWRCWQTSYCRAFVRKICPRFLERKPCWRVKEGCFCEEKIIFRALETKSDSSHKFWSQMRRELYGSPTGMEPTAEQKRMRCRRCPIYAEHQRHKYKILMPLMFPLTAAAAWMANDHVREFIELSIPRIDGFVAKYSFEVAKRVGSDAAQARSKSYSDFDIQMIYIGAMVFGTILLLTWLLKLVEYLTFRVQI